MSQPQDMPGRWRRLARRVLYGFSYSGLSSRTEVNLVQWIDHGHYCARDGQGQSTGVEGDEKDRERPCS